MSKAVLLVNLGSPASPAVGDVRRYLNEFLMDGRVIDVAWPLRRLIVGMILINRPKESAHAYEKIWTKNGSPLVFTSLAARNHLQERVTIPVAVAMRYQKPAIQDAISQLQGRGVTEMLLIPLFPHYAMSSYETAVVRVRELARKLAPQIKVVVQPPYGDSPDYIAALAASARDSLETGYDHLLFSFHGIPERHLRKADPSHAHCLASPNCCQTPNEAHKFCYRHQCFRTVEEFVKLAGIPKEKYSISFQSRLGKEPWLKPYTDFEFVRFAQAGVKRLLVISPAFVADCLETIEELGIRGRETFIGAGGKEFLQIPCMNQHPLWITALQRMVEKFQANQTVGMA
jgi:ferrochelatase